MMEDFESHGVVPDLIDIFEPTSELRIKFKSGKVASLGNVLTPTMVQDPPELSWGGDPNTLYTVITADPDAPSREKNVESPWLHWMVVNIPGELLEKGDVIAPYIGAGPPPNTGLHRYVTLIFKQSGPIRAEIIKKESRPRFALKEFINNHKLGDPIAGNLYRAEFDDYVPILYNKIESMV